MIRRARPRERSSRRLGGSGGGRRDLPLYQRRGGRPVLAGAALTRVKAPTLLIVGGHDVPVIGMNRAAMAQMRAEGKLEIVPGASHLFKEPGTIEAVARLARDWFARHLARHSAAT